MRNTAPTQRAMSRPGASARSSVASRGASGRRRPSAGGRSSVDTPRRERDPVPRLLVVQAHVRQRDRHRGGPTIHQPLPRPDRRPAAGDAARAMRGRPRRAGFRRRHVDPARVPEVRPDAPGRCHEMGGAGAATEPARPKRDGRRAIEASSARRSWAGSTSGRPWPPTSRRGASDARPPGRRHRRIRPCFAGSGRPGSCSPTSTTARTGWPPPRPEGVPIAAVQHGVIYRRAHRLHPPDPAAGAAPPRPDLRLRRWERDLLDRPASTATDEVGVGGLAAPRPRRADARWTEPTPSGGARRGARATGWSCCRGRGAPIYRRFHYPIALAELFDRPIERVHLVVKLHPSETDEGPYRAVIEGARRGGRVRAAADHRRPERRPVPAARRRPTPTSGSTRPSSPRPSSTGHAEPAGDRSRRR